LQRKPPEFADLPVPELIRRLMADVAELVRNEIRLARLEMTEKAKVLGKSIGTSIALFVVAAVFAVGAFVALTATAIAALALVLPLWVAALVVTVVYGLAALGAALAGKNALAGVISPVPEQTIESVKADVAAIAASVRRAR
jgi:uncharacterized membrane protein YqjE